VSCRPPVREERRVRVRRGAPRDPDRPARAGHGPAGHAAQPGGLGHVVTGGPAEAGAAYRPAPPGAVLVTGRAARGAADVAVPRHRPQEPTLHERGGRRAGGDRVHVQGRHDEAGGLRATAPRGVEQSRPASRVVGVSFERARGHPSPRVG
jgi:hypothetical protein